MVENAGSSVRKDENIRCADPILEAVNRLQAAMADYNSNAPMHSNDAANAYAMLTYAEPLMIIREWRLPARSMEGAIAALRMAKQADEDGDYTIVGPMLTAALAYLDEL